MLSYAVCSDGLTIQRLDQKIFNHPEAGSENLGWKAGDASPVYELEQLPQPNGSAI